MNKLTQLSLAFLVMVQNLICGSVYAATWTEEYSLDINDSHKLQIFAGRGDFKLKVQNNLDSVNVKMKVVIPGKEEQARKHFDTKMQTYLKHKGKVLKLKAGYQKGIPTSQMKGKIDLTVTIPTKLYLYLHDTHGDIQIDGLRNGLKIIDGKGDIEITDSNGAFIINDGSGDLNIKGSAGKLKINDADDDIKITSHQGEVIINDNRGDIELADIKGRVRVSDRSGSIVAKNVAGKVKLSHAKGEIKLTHVVGNVELKAKASHIKLSNVDGNVKLKKQGKGSIKLDQVSGKVTGTEGWL